MRMKSLVSVALCLLAFACKKESGDKKPGADVQVPPVVADPNSGDQTGGGGTTGPIGDGMVDAGDGAAKVCRPTADCAQELPDPGTALGFNSSTNKLFANALPYHRGRDLIVNYGQDATLIAKFAYGTGIDKDMKGEEVDIYLSLGCDKGWKKVANEVTSSEPKKGEKKIVDGVEDTGGYIMSKLSDIGLKDLAVGRHRVVLFLRANNHHTELFIEVLSPRSGIVISDIDGTLTAFEEAAVGDFLGLPVSVHEGAPDVMHAFNNRGYTIFYLTARPVFFMEKTRKWLNSKGFPPGVIHTTDRIEGAIGEAAAKFKIGEIAALKTNLGIVPSYAFGNKPSDVKAFADAGISKANSWFYKIKDDTTGAQAHSDYKTLIPAAEAAPNLCP